MHLLPCPNCQASIPVAPSQAGDQLSCPECHSDVSIPKLGQLKLLPLAEADGEVEATDEAGDDGAAARRVGFVFLGLLATASLLIGGFCTVRWAMIEAPITTEDHLDLFEAEYKKRTPAELIREYEQMEKYALDLPAEYKYKTIANEKYGWGRNAVVAGGFAGISILGAMLLSAGTRRKPNATADT